SFERLGRRRASLSARSGSKHAPNGAAEHAPRPEYEPSLRAQVEAISPRPLRGVGEADRRGQHAGERGERAGEAPGQRDVPKAIRDLDIEPADLHVPPRADEHVGRALDIEVPHALAHGLFRLAFPSALPGLAAPRAIDAPPEDVELEPCWSTRGDDTGQREEPDARPERTRPGSARLEQGLQVQIDPHRREQQADGEDDDAEREHDPELHARSFWIVQRGAALN